MDPGASKLFCSEGFKPGKLDYLGSPPLSTSLEDIAGIPDQTQATPGTDFIDVEQSIHPPPLLPSFQRMFYTILKT
jgi:hypothetical protein